MATGRARSRRREGSLLVRNAVAADLPDLAAELSPEDVAECVASTGLQATEALQFCHSQSASTWVAHEESGHVVAAGGIIPDAIDDMSLSANVWLVCSPKSSDYAKTLIRVLRKRINGLKLKYGLLYGYVDDRNKVRKRWLNLLGFRMTDMKMQGEYLNIPFRLFVSKPSDD